MPVFSANSGSSRDLSRHSEGGLPAEFIVKQSKHTPKFGAGLETADLETADLENFGALKN